MNLKVRLAVMNFLEFAVWGAYLTSMGNYLGKAGMGAEISWFYTIQGIVSIFMPTLMGIVADKYIQPQRLLGYCHLLAGAAMIGIQYIEEQRARHREGFSANPCVRNRGLHPHDVDCELCYLGQRFILVPVERERP